ncbi:MULTISPECIES: TlpA disulfide reductase family protein [Winogradskyella]|uniref:TlpA disulfide reductase family protein n=1 Tax=Winogradskyella TaxID=286104 RepID=UPI001FE8792B|nr:MULTISPECIES: TlpA disulfide reductase family protein [Winogradskyella]
MKRLVTIAIISLLFLSCKTEPKRTDFIINGTAKNIYNGVRTYLKVKQQNGRTRVIDTAIVVNEKFTFTGKVLNPTLHLITVNSVKGELDFMLENNQIDITINKSDITQSTVVGSKSNADYKTYNDNLQELNKEAEALKMQLRNRTTRDSISKLYTIVQNKQKEAPLNFIDKNRSSYYSLVLIKQKNSKDNTNIEDYIEAFNKLDADIQNSPEGVAIKINLDKALADYLKTAQIEIGKVAPNFEAPNLDGKMVSLNDVKGKVTIIDFWAAWCGPCRRENPNVVRIYNKYHDQGLEIIGVSLDGTRNQKDPKNAWLNAIKTDKLTWTHVSNLQYFKDPIVELYNVTAIPATFILDKDGKIAAKNLRGRALELKVQELLK